MKSFLYFWLITLVLINKNNYSQNNSAIDSIPFIYELGSKEFQCWDSIYSIWQKEDFFKCIRQFNLKMSCASCTSIYFDAVIGIDSVGKIKELNIYKRKICGKEKHEGLEKCIFDYFLQIQYPPILYNQRFRAKFGNGLKC